MALFDTYPVRLYNTLHKQKETFQPLHPPSVGMYVCGPTVYGDPHLGHARAAITFDIVKRYFEYLGYRVRYVRNITDVGHLEDEEYDRGEDKIARKARLEKLEPMEIAQYYTHRYHAGMDALQCLRPDIEPTAAGHIIEQIELVKKLLTAGIAYEVDGSVYFDLTAYASSNNYGALSGKVLEELISGSRDTEGLDEKRGPHDFALWKKASETHIMRWPSPWSVGFPGWHTECSAMSTKYLGDRFDIHGGGLDLQFPHHEAEIAQCRMANGKDPAVYWMHNNMITIGGAKMSKSAGNFITLEQLFNGEHELLEHGYSPVTVRFLVLQSHYRSKIDFSNEALQAAERGVKKLFGAADLLKALDDQLMEKKGQETQGVSQDKDHDQMGGHKRLRHGESLEEAGIFPVTPLDKELAGHLDQFYHHMSDDFNTARALAELFDLASKTYALQQGQIPVDALSTAGLAVLKKAFTEGLCDVLGLIPDTGDHGSSSLSKGLIDFLIDLRADARSAKNFELSDKIRDQLQAMGVQLKDDKSGKTFYDISR